MLRLGRPRGRPTTGRLTLCRLALPRRTGRREPSSSTRSRRQPATGTAGDPSCRDSAAGSQPGAAPAPPKPATADAGPRRDRSRDGAGAVARAAPGPGTGCRAARLGTDTAEPATLHAGRSRTASCAATLRHERFAQHPGENVSANTFRPGSFRSSVPETDIDTVRSGNDAMSRQRWNGSRGWLSRQRRPAPPGDCSRSRPASRAGSRPRPGCPPVAAGRHRGSIQPIQPRAGCAAGSGSAPGSAVVGPGRGRRRPTLPPPGIRFSSPTCKSSVFRDRRV